ncbi:MAG: FKBP-type peptidyl-prolyl cis-trans isomerase [Bacteroidales bacterium]|nr:FKBP-type peptidyl-prolyl cis-trans isomerase [Bacteroidales bacterium]
MKTITLTLSVILISIVSFAQEQKSEQENVQEIRLANQSDSLQYALGAFLGQWLVNNNFQIVNANLFLQGMDDVIQNKTLAVTDSTIAPIISAYQLSNQYEKNKQMEDQLFASLKGKAGVGVLPSGVNYIIIEKGTGNRPNSNSNIVFHAKGVFPDGTLFEDTYQKNQAITNVVSKLIPGLSESIQLMPVGSKWRIFIPSALAYGSVGVAEKVPPYTALVFDISLLEIKEK